jgi:hypothetical protein
MTYCESKNDFCKKSGGSLFSAKVQNATPFLSAAAPACATPALAPPADYTPSSPPIGPCQTTKQRWASWLVHGFKLFPDPGTVAVVEVHAVTHLHLFLGRTPTLTGVLLPPPIPYRQVLQAPLWDPDPIFLYSFICKSALFYLASYSHTCYSLFGSVLRYKGLHICIAWSILL